MTTVELGSPVVGCGSVLTLLCCVQNPSSVFWKELVLAMPRRMAFQCESAGDPQTMRQEDKDPMLTLDPDYLDCRSETDPAGDLGTGTAGSGPPYLLPIIYNIL